jgi:hypothetical protein
MGGIESSIDIESTSMGSSPQIVSPLVFFVVNDGKKPNPFTIQTMCFLVCHFVYQTCSVGNTTKKRIGMIS